MQVSEQFAKVLRAGIAAALLVALALIIGDTISPRHEVRAQNAGTVGIQAELVPVFSAQSTNRSSGIFADIGQGLNILYYSTTSFVGTVTLEWSPNNNGVYLPLVTAGFSSADTDTHQLTVNGYWPNLRATVAVTSGSVSAWYSASSGPVGFAAPGVGSNGPTSPPVCDQASATVITSTNTAGIIVSPRIVGQTIAVCSFDWSFNGATSAGSVALAYSTSSGCPSTSTTWAAYTTSSTPQFMPVGLSQRQPPGAGPYLCAINNSGATAYLSVSYASVHP
jgi:hypothetical protein